MMTSFSLSQTLASLPNSFLKTPMVPGPQTSCVMRTSVFTQTFSPGLTWALPAALARICSVIVMDGISGTPLVSEFLGLLSSYQMGRATHRSSLLTHFGTAGGG